MATFTPTVPAQRPATSRGDRNNLPPIPGGGDDGRPDFGSPDHAVRLRRARLGLVVALTPILMLFVSFTSAYVFRQGLPTLDPATNRVVRDWSPIPLPNTLFLINTLLLVASSVTVELARRRIARRVALEPVQSIPGVSLGRSEEFPWLGLTIVLGIGFLTGQFLAWRDLAARGFFVS